MWAWFEDSPFLAWHTRRWPHLQELFPVALQVPRDGVVLEVGAWVGTFVREAVNQGARQVIAMEPEPANFVCLQKNFVEEIAAGRVVLVKAAAWSHDGVEPFGHPEFDENGKPQLGGEGFRALPGGGVSVRTVKIDTLIEELAVESLDLIEMDVEGGERYALEGARQTLGRFAPQILVCEHHLPDDGEAVPRAILSAYPAYIRSSKDGHAYYRAPAKDCAPGLDQDCVVQAQARATK
jgi:FkbM family methyltransferase